MKEDIYIYVLYLFCSSYGVFEGVKGSCSKHFGSSVKESLTIIQLDANVTLHQDMDATLDAESCCITCHWRRVGELCFCLFSMQTSGIHKELV